MPSIVKFLGIGEIVGASFIALGRESGDLIDVLDGMSRVICIQDIQEIARQLVSTLSRLEGVGIIHGDIKPENILARDTEVCLGYASRQQAAASKTNTIALMKNTTISLCDFGHSSKEPKDSGTVGY